MSEVVQLAPMDVPPEVIDALEKWVVFFRELLWGEAPIRIHDRNVLDRDGKPQWHAEFAQWLSAEPPWKVEHEAYVDKDQRLRTTRVFRKLRRKMPREFDVMYLLVVRRPPMSIPEIGGMMNERAIRNGKPERYTTDDILILAISGLDKVTKWW